MKLLTKSSYMLGLQCPKLLWYKEYKPELFQGMTDVQQYLFKQGAHVGKLATKLFPGGIHVPFNNFMDNIRKSQELIEGHKTLFEAGFMNSGMFARADILKPVGNMWDLIEVKSSTRVKEEHIQDVAFQKVCYERAAVPIRKCFLLHINSDYIRKGDININELFKLDEITNEVEKEIEHTIEAVDRLLLNLEVGEPPETPIGPQCEDNCVLRSKCFEDAGDLFDLIRGKQKAFKLSQAKIKNIADIPTSVQLTEQQQIQKQAVDGPLVNKPEISKFTSGILYPIHFLDFESYATAIPIHQDTKPYQQIVFQFSLHIQEASGKPLRHISFLAKDMVDPREEFIKNLKQSIQQTGSIVVYYQPFEWGRLKELAELFPEYSSWINSLQERLVDLMIPFKNMYFYSPEQKGRMSLKKVLPAVTGQNYNDLKIAKGDLASIKFVTSYENPEIRKQLEEYCGYDTKALSLILNVLKTIT